MYEKRIEFLRKAIGAPGASDNLSPLARNLIKECLDAVEKLQEEIDDRTMQQQETIGRLWEKQATIKVLREEVSELLQEQRLVTFAVERYPAMWMSNWPRLKDVIAQRLCDEEKGLIVPRGG